MNHSPAFRRMLAPVLALALVCTLSLPASEEELVSDVVFVLDKSTSAALEEQALEMLSNLKAQVENTGASVKVGVVIFNKTANKTDWMDLGTQYEDIEAAITEEIRTKEIRKEEVQE